MSKPTKPKKPVNKDSWKKNRYSFARLAKGAGTHASHSAEKEKDNDL